MLVQCSCLLSRTIKFQYDLFSAFSGGGQSGSGPMAGMAGMGLGALPMNPALVAAASLLKLRRLYLRRSEENVEIDHYLMKNVLTSALSNFESKTMSSQHFAGTGHSFLKYLSGQLHIYRTFRGSFFYISTCRTWTRCCNAPFCSTVYCPCRFLHVQRGLAYVGLWDTGNRKDGKGTKASSDLDLRQERGGTKT